MTSTDLTRGTAFVVIELVIGGMTCASCAARIEKSLNRIDGVSASVNYALESATVRYAEPVSVEKLITTIQDAWRPKVVDVTLLEPVVDGEEPNVRFTLQREDQ